MGGLFAGSAFTLYALAFGVSAARNLLSIDPRDITAIGLAVALLSGIPALFTDHPFLTGVWVKLPFVEIGTPLIFDIGVYLVVLGVLLTFVYSLGEEE